MPRDERSDARSRRLRSVNGSLALGEASKRPSNPSGSLVDTLVRFFADTYSTQSIRALRSGSDT